MSAPATDELIRHLELLARMNAIQIEMETREIRHVKDTWAWKARDRLRELEAEVLAEKELKTSRQLGLELIRANVTGVMLDTDWRHKKSRDVYMVLGGYRIEATNTLGILYARNGVVWGRPSEEFLDGRFEALG